MLTNLAVSAVPPPLNTILSTAQFPQLTIDSTKVGVIKDPATGLFSWPITWKLTQPAPKGGYVIQHVILSVTANGQKLPVQDYWEAWPVQAGATTVTNPMLTAAKKDAINAGPNAQLKAVQLDNVANDYFGFAPPTGVTSYTFNITAVAWYFDGIPVANNSYLTAKGPGAGLGFYKPGTLLARRFEPTAAGDLPVIKDSEFIENHGKSIVGWVGEASFYGRPFAFPHSLGTLHEVTATWKQGGQLDVTTVP